MSDPRTNLFIMFVLLTFEIPSVIRIVKISLTKSLSQGQIRSFTKEEHDAKTT